MTPIENLYSIYLKFPRISTDSRNVIPGSIFFALKGDHFDGNRFASEALSKGAACAVISDSALATGKEFILVPDTLMALQQLAAFHRNSVKAKIIGITGSNGKTTTKELIGKVLATSFKTITTRGNLNNHIGVPLTVLSIEKDTAFAVVEMGANHPGEIARLCQIARPHYGIITNIGKAHLEGFGSFEGVIKAKSELYDFIRQSEGLAFLNIDDPLLSRLSQEIKLFTYGSSENADCKGQITARDPFLGVAWSSGMHSGYVSTTLYGDYNFENVMAAVSMGLFFGVSPEQIENAISLYIPENNRSQMIKTAHNTLFLDAYNANPSSMKAALTNFHKIGITKKMIILGDMMELGQFSLEEHRSIIELARKLNFNRVICVGEYFSMAAKGGQEICFSNVIETELWLQHHPVYNMDVLLKGSRKVQLEKLINLL
jgi:UDP-N-acetylmuramoyl-tripeptide--D-alanyl-D-alanine ligase